MPQCWNPRSQRQFSKRLYFVRAEGEGNKWCSVSLRVLKIIRLPFQDRNILTWCSSWTNEWKAESKTNLLSLDVGEAISHLPTWLFSSSIDSLPLQTLTLLPYDYYYSLYLPKFLTRGPTRACQTRQYHRFWPQASTHWPFLLPCSPSSLFSPYHGIWPQRNWGKIPPPLQCWEFRQRTAFWAFSHMWNKTFQRESSNTVHPMEIIWVELS